MQSIYPHYSMVIKWDAEDGIFVVELPEWGPYCKAYGKTYEEAAKNGREVLELLMDPTGEPEHVPRPLPHLSQTVVAQINDMAETQTHDLLQPGVARRQTA
jgi:antitoxin HicB